MIVCVIWINLLGNSIGQSEIVSPLPSNTDSDIHQVSSDIIIFTELSAKPKTLVLDKGIVSVDCHVSLPCEVGLKVFDEMLNLYYESPLKQVEQGKVCFQWDGKDAKGKCVSPGVYLYQIVGKGTETISDQTLSYRTAESIIDFSGCGMEIKPKDFTFNPNTGEFQFIAPKPVRARMRIGIEDFPHLLDFLDWEPLEAGKHSFKWDGYDASGNIKLIDHPKLAAYLRYYTIPECSIIVKSNAERTGYTNQRLLDNSGLKSNYPEHAFFHALHPRSRCHAIRFNMEFLNQHINSDGITVVSGDVPVRIHLHPDDKSWVVDERFEVMFYVDTQYIYEEEDGSSPFTYTWDTNSLSEGFHVLTVNILSYNDHLGVVSRKVLVKKPTTEE